MERGSINRRCQRDEAEWFEETDKGARPFQNKRGREGQQGGKRSGKPKQEKTQRNRNGYYMAADQKKR